MGSKNTARQALGELFITGFNGLELSTDTSSFLSEAKIGGVILSSHNFENPGQMAELSNQIQDCRSRFPLWISVDQEGGKVQRLKKGFTRIPEAAAIGAADSPKLAFEIAEVIAKELKAVGVNLNFCPVADIITNPKNAVIGSRSYGAQEELVSKMITAILRGHLVNGVQPCLKHFPGHGETCADSQFALPRVETPLETLQEREFRPFMKAIRSKCSLVKTAHIICTKVDPKFPATLSPIMLREILRNQLRYNKVIVSDDLEMKSITDHFGAEQAPRLALQAGCDLLIYRTEAATRLAYESLLKDLESGVLAPEVVLEAENRVKALKREFFTSYHPVAVSEVAKKIGTPEHLAIVQKLEERNKFS
jgi:beta-N-acetylhexosaminidase